MRHHARLILLACCIPLIVAMAATGDGAQRPFIALAHPGQVLTPHFSTTSNLTAFFLLDEPTRELTFTVSEGDVELLWVLRGPAVPGEVGNEIAFGVWSAGENKAGPLTKTQVRALRRGRLYIEFFQPTALPESPRAMRGQLLPIPGVRY